MSYKYALSKTLATPHIGHALEFTEDVRLHCSTCGEDLWSHRDTITRANENDKKRMANMRVEDPDRYRELNREARRRKMANIKADPVRYARHLAKAKEYNARAIAKKKAASTL